MLKMQNKIIDSLLVSILALGLGGCAFNGNVATHKVNNEPTSAKVTKQGSHKKSAQTNKVATASTSSEKASVSSSNSEQTTSNSQVASTNSYAKAATQSSAAAQNQATTVTNKAASTNNTANNIQLGQSDIAVWTDKYGIVHHVDANGLDYQTIPGSSQVHYETWNGQLPANAQVIHNAGPNVPAKSDKYQEEVQLGLGDTAVWTDQYGIVHHVDSDGLDRQTIPGSSQVHYQDWSGSLPAEAQIVYNK